MFCSGECPTSEILDANNIGHWSFVYTWIWQLTRKRRCSYSNTHDKRQQTRIACRRWHVLCTFWLHTQPKNPSYQCADYVGALRQYSATYLSVATTRNSEGRRGRRSLICAMYKHVSLHSRIQQDANLIRRRFNHNCIGDFMSDTSWGMANSVLIVDKLHLTWHQVTSWIWFEASFSLGRNLLMERILCDCAVNKVATSTTKLMLKLSYCAWVQQKLNRTVLGYSSARMCFLQRHPS